MNKLGKKMISVLLAMSLAAVPCSADFGSGELLEAAQVTAAEHTADAGSDSGAAGLMDGGQGGLDAGVDDSAAIIAGDGADIIVEDGSASGVMEGDAYSLVETAAEEGTYVTVEAGGETAADAGTEYAAEAGSEEAVEEAEEETEAYEEALALGVESAEETEELFPGSEAEFPAGSPEAESAQLTGEGVAVFDEVVEYTVIDDPIVTEVSTGGERRRSLLVGAADAEYTTDFYSQLDDMEKTVYNYRKAYFGDQKKTDTLEIQFDSTDDFFYFSCPIVKNAEGKWVIDKTSAEYTEAYEKTLSMVRASFDAFYYDHPEVFWTRSTKMSIGYSSTGTAKNRYVKVYLSSIHIEPVEAFTGASGLIDAFDAAVDETVAYIQSNSDYNQDGTTEVSELLQGAHDYVVNTCYYDSEGLNTYKKTEDYRIFTPAGAFLESVGRGIVCEGYSRALKVLCDRLDIECALIKGKTSATASIGHQWNAVKLDGDWFLVDSTWDDSGNRLRYDYYLCYQVSGRIIDNKIAGANYTVSTSDGRSYTVTTKSFAYPYIPDGTHKLNREVSSKKLSGCQKRVTYSCDDEAHTNVKRYAIEPDHTEVTISGVKATCTKDGLTDGKKCSVCGEILEEQKVIPAAHTPETVAGKAATCTEDGLTDGKKCSVCGEILEEQKVIPAAHTPETVAGKAATCTEDGLTDGLKCSVCEEILEEQEVIPAKGHTPVTVQSKAATCTATGLTEGKKCSVCGEILEEQKVIPKTAHRPVADPAVPASTEATGLTAGSHCSVCGTVLTAQQVIPKLAVTLTVKAKGMQNNKVTLKKGKTLQLKVTSNAKVTYSSSNAKVAKVSAKGKIKAKKKGKATITVKAGNKKVKIKVTVKQK